MSLRFSLFGHPVGHSLSPVIHHAAYRELGLSHRYELRDIPDLRALESAMSALRTGEIAGANVTVPWKREALALADHRAPSAERVGAANVLCPGPGGALSAHNTDVPALAEEVRSLRGVPKTALVLGSGGAALAAVVAMQLLGASEVAVVARRFSKQTPASLWQSADEFRRLGAQTLAWPEPPGETKELVDFCERVEVIVQATSAGMRGGEPGEQVARAVPWRRVGGDALAYDLVYNPPETEFLTAARARGLARSHGLGMLVGQAALAIELWLGVRPPSGPLRAAAEAELESRAG